MTTAICTLFENDYHHGVATLFNSLVRNGYRGRLYAGYRGPRPAWSASGKQAAVGTWSDAWILDVADGCEIVFLPLVTDAHFTNIKPDFMLSLFAQAALGVDYLLYLDPDICVTRDWRYLDDWTACGVALCEDVNSPIAEHHPKRVGWRRHFGERGIELGYRSAQYVNGGCVGVSRADSIVLWNWKLLSGHMATVIGGLGVAKVGKGSEFATKGFAHCFDCSDQDALNAALQMTPDVAFSVLPRSAMGFEHGELVLPHALGPEKPWRRRYLANALRAVSPHAADRAFWAYADGPVRHVSKGRLFWARATLGAAGAVARLYSRR